MMSKINRYEVARVLLGLIFLVFGLNGFFNFLPPPALTEPGLKFIMALIETGYLMLLIKGIEVAAGILLLCNRKVPLAILMLLPIVTNIVLFHAILSPGLALPVIIVILMIIVIFGKRAVFDPLIR